MSNLTVLTICLSFWFAVLLWRVGSLERRFKRMQDGHAESVKMLLDLIAAKHVELSSSPYVPKNTMYILAPPLNDGPFVKTKPDDWKV